MNLDFRGTGQSQRLFEIKPKFTYQAFSQVIDEMLTT